MALLVHDTPGCSPAVPAVPAVLVMLAALATLGASPAFCDAEPQSGSAAAERFAVHGQFTYVEQETSEFNAPYSGPNSLSPNKGAETTDVTLYLGGALWSGAEAWLCPEIDQGFGLDDTLGVAAFPSAEAYKVGKNQPYFRLPRLFLRDTIDLGGDMQTVDPGLFQLAGQHSSNRLVITAGKFGVTDVFDNNDYAHDSRNDFLNWAAVDAGSFDYAADAWGYTAGIAVEWYQGGWTTRFGVFDLSDVPNSPDLEPAFHEFQLLAEIERRFELGGRDGKLLFTAFDSRGRMGLLDQAVEASQNTGTPVNIAAVRRYRGRLGGDFNWQQALTGDIGVFARVGKAQGNVETYEFTDIDRSIAAGLSVKGTAWRRRDDTVGLAVLDDAISGDRERYLNAGGLGVLVGDGKLPHPGTEDILESYYRVEVLSHLQLTFDYQWVDHPAYNRDRGPVSLFAVRVHAQF